MPRQHEPPNGHSIRNAQKCVLCTGTPVNALSAVRTGSERCSKPYTVNDPQNERSKGENDAER
jgi:hypothetical protein